MASTDAAAFPDAPAPAYFSGEFCSRGMTLGTGWTIDALKVAFEPRQVFIEVIGNPMLTNDDPT